MNNREMRKKFFQYEVLDSNGNYYDMVYIEKESNWDTTADAVREVLVANYNYPEDITVKEMF